MLDPVRDELFTAAKGHGAQLNGVPLKVSLCTSLDRALVGTVFPARDTPRLSAYLPILHAVMTRCAGLRRGGACSLDLAYVAAGRLDGFWVVGLNKRDIAARALLVHEAGGRVGDFAGGVEFLKSDELVAASPGVFSELREVIRRSACLKPYADVAWRSRFESERYARLASAVSCWYNACGMSTPAAAASFANAARR